MKIFSKIVRIGLLSSAILLNLEPIAAHSAVIQSPTITIQKVTPDTNNPVTLQYKSNLSSPTWQTLRVFSGSIRLVFWNRPSGFFRGVCTNLTVSATLMWPASTDPSVTGYKVYYGTASGNYTHSIDVGLATSATISNLIAGTRYYFAAKAYNASGVESPPSNEINGAFQASFSLVPWRIRQVGLYTVLRITQAMPNVTTIAPLPYVITKRVTAGINHPVTLQFTTNLSFPNWHTLGTFSGSTNLSFTNLPAVFIRGYCSNLTASATLAWQPSSDPAVVGYKVYYGVASHDYTKTVNVGPATTATISNLVKGTTYYFAVTAYNSANVESSFSNEASGAFQPSFSITIGNP